MEGMNTQGNNKPRVNKSKWRGRIHPPSIIEYAQLRIILMESPTNDNLDAYVAFLQQHGCSVLVRVCEATYDTVRLTKNSVGIEALDLSYPDGTVPTGDLIRRWLQLVGLHSTVAVHCVAG